MQLQTRLMWKSSLLSRGEIITIVSPMVPNESKQQIVVGHIGQVHYVAVDNIIEKNTSTEEHIQETISISDNSSTGGQAAPPSLDNVTSWQTATWRETSSDEITNSNSCPIDGPLTFFKLLNAFIPTVSNLLKSPSVRDALQKALLASIALACEENKNFGDAKVNWLVATGQISSRRAVAASKRFNALGSEFDRFF